MRTILQRISDGDGTAIDACLREYGDLVWRLASRYLDRAPGEIEDAVQEVFVELWLHAGRFDPALGGEATFVATLAHRRLTDYQRRVTVRRRLVRSSEDATESGVSPGVLPSAGDPGAKGGRSAEALEAMDGLPEDEKHALGLWLYRGLTHRQISEATDAPIGTIKSRLRRGLIRIGEAVGARPAGAGDAEGGVA